MKYLPILYALLFIASPIMASTLEKGADAPTRTLEDYIKDYVDVPPGATDWKVFGRTKQIDIRGRTPDGYDLQYYKPKFTPEVKALEGKQVTIKGFMFPLDETEKQKLFLIGPFPINCPYQYHVGPSLVIEVHTDKHPIKFSYDPIVIAGTLQLVPKDPDNNIFYRLMDAKQVNQ